MISTSEHICRHKGSAALWPVQLFVTDVQRCHDKAST